ncbi:MAG: hypothetical protein CL910_15775 [Deltaproteobacteria bacterium]|nr:hypothetical protein [Deltaproteobacteria bacterium]
MSDPGFTSGRSFRLRHTALLSAVGIPGAGLVVVYLATILTMTTAQWWTFAEGVGLAFVILSILMPFQQGRYERPGAHAIDEDLAGTLESEGLEKAFGQLALLPRRDVFLTLFSWAVSGLFVPAYMLFRLDSVSWFTAAVVAIAAISSGVVASVFLHFGVKRMVHPLSQHWVRRISDPARRRELIRPVTLVRKLATPMMAVSVVTLGFALLLSYELANRPVEAQDVRVKSAYAGYVVGELAKDPGKLAELEATGAVFAAAEHLLIFDRASGELLEGSPGALHASELRWLLATGELSGNSTGFDSFHSFVWQAMDESGQRLLVATTPGSSFTVGQSTSRIAFAVLMAVALALTFLTCWTLARDVGVTTQRLNARVDRVARGDLIDHEIVESDDELGALARSFDEMVLSLRQMIGNVARAADGVDSAGAELGGVGEAVTAATRDQRAGIEQATTQVASVNNKVAEITESAQALNANVEEASSSVLQLGAASDELNQTATTLTEHVDEVTGSVEQMIRSVDQVGENTEGLAQGVTETASSMAEMAAAMSDVNGNAAETARLSSQMVTLSERGQHRVHETISGMDAIREATETADKVVRSLAGRVVEIGAIVDVIDDVADETNLLALNAAIIAARAGDQGRSFSVVADEIKDLADRVLSSTKEIGGLIRAVQHESANATQAIVQGGERVQSGVEVAAEAGLALEEITTAARDSGGRIDEIVQAVREQSSAASHVAGLMERVSSEVDEIRQAGSEQRQGNEVMQRGAHVTRDVAQQTLRTTEEQSRGAGRIRSSMESIRDAVDRIHLGLQEQSDSCRATVDFLEQVFERTSSNDESCRRLETATGDLNRQALTLRQDLQRFRLEESRGDKP